MKHTGKIREFIWKQHPFGITVYDCLYTVSVKAFVSLHMVIRLSIKHINSCTCTSFKQEIRVHFFTKIQIQICNPKTDIFVSLLKSKNALLIQN